MGRTCDTEEGLRGRYVHGVMVGKGEVDGADELGVY
jgi:hypothetical protein